MGNHNLLESSSVCERSAPLEVDARADVTDDPVVREPFLHEGDLTRKVIALADRGDSAVAEALHAGMGCFRRLRTSSVACDVAADIVKPFAARAADGADTPCVRPDSESSGADPENALGDSSSDKGNRAIHLVTYRHGAILTRCWKRGETQERNS